MMKMNDQSQYCHAEPIRFAQGKLRDASGCPSREILRCAQHDKRPAIITDLGRSSSLSANGPSMRSPGRYIGGAGMKAPPTQRPGLVVKVHYRAPPRAGVVWV